MALNSEFESFDIVEHLKLRQALQNFLGKTSFRFRNLFFMLDMMNVKVQLYVMNN